MDPVSALGFAAAIVQFITITSKILTSTVTLCNSATSDSSEIMSLENIYVKLKTVSLNVSDAAKKAAHIQEPSRSIHSQGQWSPTTFFLGLFDEDLAVENPFPTLQDSYASLRNLLDTCDSDCSKLLTIVGKIKATSNLGSRWSCFRTALKLFWKRDEIAQIEDSLERLQRLVTIQMCNISNIYHDIHLRELGKLKKESEYLGIQQSVQIKSIESMLQTLVERLQGSEGTSVPTDSLPTQLSRLERSMLQLGISERRVGREMSILRSLGFENRKVRHVSIPIAHRETFQWVFEPSKEGESSALLDWLINGQEHFWVAGKPGSGKSTFMKFLADHPTTCSALAQWSHPLPVIIASHYLWSPGTEMQKSQQGLLQSLLYEIFRHCPDLIEAACESRWTLSNENDQVAWTLPELWSTLEAIPLQNLADRKFCFFIDGLDEIPSANLDMMDFCEALITKLNAPNIKMCLSSRPWNVFEDSFGQEAHRKLYIHDLTRLDILRFARSRLCEHPRWRVLQTQSRRAEELIECIADRSQGVFLWVSIMTRLLREGLTNGDSFSHLRKMLDSFPSDLEPFFKAILESVPSIYRERMAESLQIALYAKEPLDAVIYSFHDDSEDVEIGCAIDMPGYENGEETLRLRREQIIRRLNGICRGLLEQNFLGQVDFLHRTLVDFLRTQDMTEFLRTQSSHTFNASLAILKAHVAWIKSAGIDDGEFSIGISTSGFKKGSLYESMLARGIQKALRYAVAAEMETSVDKTALDTVIDDMDYAVSTLMSSVSLKFLNDKERIKAFEINSLDTLFKETVLDMPLLGYLSRKLPGCRVYFSGLDQPALLKAVFPAFPCNVWPKQASQKLTCLLQNGHDPNQLMLGGLKTVWQEFLSKILPDNTANSSRNVPRFRAAFLDGLVQVFLEHGADPNARLSMDSSSAFEILLSFPYQIFSATGEAKEMQSAYLTVLDSFIRHGATFGSRNTEGHLTRYHTLFFEDEDPVVLFFVQLEKTFNISASPSQADELMDIAQRILVLAYDAKFPMDRLQASLNAVLGNTTQRKGHDTSRKRFEREEWEGETSNKRPRRTLMENQ